MLLFIGLYAISAMRRFWRKELFGIWVVTLAAICVLMWGGVFGLSFVTEQEWGGLPITLLLATFGLAAAFPLSVFVALGRRSLGPAGGQAAVRGVCRADPRRAADHRAVHGQRDVPAVHAAGDQPAAICCARRWR